MVDVVECHRYLLPSTGNYAISEIPVHHQLPQLTATSFNIYAGASQLVLINCPGVGLQGVQHILSTAFTAVETLALQCYGGYWGDQLFSNRHLAEVSVLQAFTLGRNLCWVDLTGLRDLTERGIKKLQLAIQKAQSEGRAQQSVKVVLPARSMSSILRGHCQVLGVVMPYLHLPPLWLDPKDRGCRIVVCQPKQSAKYQVAKVLRNVILMLALRTVWKRLSDNE